MRSPTLVARDMLLMENQLPFFLLEDLFNYFFPPGVEGAKKLQEWALKFFSKFMECSMTVGDSDSSNITNCKHILHLFHSWITCTKQTNHGQSSTTSRSSRHDLPQVSEEEAPAHTSSKSEEKSSAPLRRIPSATKMKAAGVKFKKKDKPNSFLDVSFDNGQMVIPQLEVDDDTNILLRNLIAFEQCYGHVETIVTAHASLFTCAIQSANDVALLERQDIIAIGLGNSEQVAHLFNKLCVEVVIDHNKCYLSQVFVDIKKYCNRKRNRWCAKFRKDHLSTPWSIIAFVVAVMLFVITITQLVFTILKFLKC